MGTRYTTNVHVPGRVDGSLHRVRLTVDGDGTLLWCEWYVDAKLKGCGPTMVGLPVSVAEHADERLSFHPTGHPMYWRAR